MRFFFALTLSLHLTAAGSCLALDEPADEGDRDFGKVEEVWDPLEPMNRGIFWFNDRVDRYFLEPVARGYDWVMPDRGQRMISNFYYNLGYPSRLLGDLLQFKLGQSLEHTASFVVNTTLGVGGLFEVAEEFGLERHEEDLGGALQYWGVPAGPYLVLPLLGPSNLRDGIGTGVDLFFLDPVWWAAYETADDDDAIWISWGSTSLKGLNRRARLLDAVDSAREAAVDEYLFLQSAYYQYRAGLVYDGNVERHSLGDEDSLEGNFLDEGFE